LRIDPKGEKAVDGEFTVTWFFIGNGSHLQERKGRPERLAACSVTNPPATLTVISGDGKFIAMDSKPSIEQFIYHCFRERTAALKRRLQVHQVYWRRYYHGECNFDSRRGAVERSEAEKIVEVTASECESAVVTIGGLLNLRLRYRVKSSGESWLIQEVDTQCAHCRASGAATECTECVGTGWQSWKAQQKRHAKFVQGSAKSRPDEEIEGRPFRDPSLEQFMADLFRERTEELKKEMEIHADYARRFYSPECDWARWLVSVPGSEVERIVNMEHVDTGARVITRDFNNGMRLRYNLHRTGPSWLVGDVDSECPVCYQQGMSADCIWCGGTIWERKKG